jgi:hypothetical protein
MKRYTGILEAKTYFYFDKIAEDRKIIEANKELLIELENFRDQGDVKIISIEEHEIK